jgi:hypothetical protein
MAKLQTNELNAGQSTMNRQQSNNQIFAKKRVALSEKLTNAQAQGKLLPLDLPSLSLHDLQQLEDLVDLTPDDIYSNILENIFECRQHYLSAQKNFSPYSDDCQHQKAFIGHPYSSVVFIAGGDKASAVDRAIRIWEAATPRILSDDEIDAINSKLLLDFEWMF